MNRSRARQKASWEDRGLGFIPSSGAFIETIGRLLEDKIYDCVLVACDRLGFGEEYRKCRDANWNRCAGEQGSQVRSALNSSAFKRKVFSRLDQSALQPGTSSGMTYNVSG